MVDSDLGSRGRLVGAGGLTRIDGGEELVSLVCRARSSAGERSLHTREVAGSKPAVPIQESAGKKNLSWSLATEA